MLSWSTVVLQNFECRERHYVVRGRDAISMVSKNFDHDIYESSSMLSQRAGGNGLDTKMAAAGSFPKAAHQLFDSKTNHGHMKQVVGRGDALMAKVSKTLMLPTDRIGVGFFHVATYW